MISNLGPGVVKATPPGVKKGSNDLFTGDPSYSYEVVLVMGKRATIEVCSYYDCGSAEVAHVHVCTRDHHCCLPVG